MRVIPISGTTMRLVAEDPDAPYVPWQVTFKTITATPIRVWQAQRVTHELFRDEQAMKGVRAALAQRLFQDTGLPELEPYIRFNRMPDSIPGQDVLVAHVAYDEVPELNAVVVLHREKI